MTLHLLQHLSPDGTRSVIAVDHGVARYLLGVATVLELAQSAIAGNQTIAAAAGRHRRGDHVNIADELAAGRLLAPIDHPDPAHLLMSGTGLTHLGSAAGRDKMHKSPNVNETDSMRMFREGLEGGRPAPGTVGFQPEWFFKGDGTSLAGPGAPLVSPDFALDGGEEPEIAGIYLIGPDGNPNRIGFCVANEFSDHLTERHNYLWLAHSKLRCASLGPALLTGDCPDAIEGTSRVIRDGNLLWEAPFLTGEAHMAHSIANLEAHHFKYDLFRRPGDIHVHFFGTATLSFSAGVRTQPGDVFEIAASPFLLPLVNTLKRGEPVQVKINVL